ncbi:SRPBCC family protein [Fredinandcohnia sp. 179-A 10B2 NHS]|uniref:SRPBCC family protein n=1 Tax=Fredinandcohnia sp. 179-A 10B2 NHS TaxID=3235176 RepID=UPI0039A07B1E
MKITKLIDLPISSVFAMISSSKEREKWFLNVTNITYHNQLDEMKPGATYTLTAVEGNHTVTLKGTNKDIISPTLYSFELRADKYVMYITYRLHADGNRTLVEQEFETIYHLSFMNFVEKLFKSITKQTAELVLSGLKAHCELKGKEPN